MPPIVSRKLYGLVRVDLRLQSGAELIQGLPESEAYMIRPLIPAKLIDNGTSLCPELLEDWHRMVAEIEADSLRAELEREAA